LLGITERIGDSSFAVLDLVVARSRHGLICVTRLRPDAALHEPTPPGDHLLAGRGAVPQRTDAAADALAAVRREIWKAQVISISRAFLDE
jgi:hypothetical protein